MSSEDQERQERGETIVQASMSLDGFVADTKDQVGPLFDWYGNALFRAGLIDEGRIDPVPVVFGAGVRYFGDYAESPLPLDDPEIVQGDRVTHLQYRVRKC